MGSAQSGLGWLVVGLAAILLPGSLVAQSGPTGPGATPPAAAAPIINFDAEGALASGITPHGQAVWLGVSREFPDGTALVVRPKVGAWGARVGDGGPDDEDPAPGSFRTTLAHLHPLGASPAPPEKFQAEDVVVVVDPNQMSFSLWHLGHGQGQGGKEEAR